MRAIDRDLKTLEAEIVYSIAGFQKKTGRIVTRIHLEPYLFAPDDKGKRSKGTVVRIETD